MRISDWSSDVCSSDLAGIPAGQDGLNLSTEDFVATAGIRNLYTRDRAIFLAAKQYGVSIDMRYQVAPRMEMFSGLTYTKRKLPTRELSINASSGQFGLSVLPADNPYNPFGVDVRSEEHTSELQSIMRNSY